MRSVLLIVGILSLGVGALFLRRTNNYKRFLSYSTVENMGIAAIGLGIGGIGVWAALFHVFCHTLVKSSLFLQMAVVRQVYDSYRINRIGDYIRINRVGAVGLLTGMVVLVSSALAAVRLRFDDPQAGHHRPELVARGGTPAAAHVHRHLLLLDRV